MNEDMTLEENVRCLKKTLGMSELWERDEYDYENSVMPDKFYILTVERAVVPGHYVIYKKLPLDRFTRVLDNSERERYLADCKEHNWSVNLDDYGKPFHYRYTRYYVGDDGRMYIRKEDK